MISTEHLDFLLNISSDHSIGTNNDEIKRKKAVHWVSKHDERDSYERTDWVILPLGPLRLLVWLDYSRHFSIHHRPPK